MLAPALALIAAFFAALSTVLALSISGPDGAISLKAYGDFLGDSHYRAFLWRSIWIASYVSVIAVILGYPIAYVMSRGSRRFAAVATLVLAVQFFSIYVVKMYGWMLVLGNNGVVNRSLRSLGLIDAPLKLMYNEFGVAVGLFASALPLMVFPINAVLQNVNRKCEEAALGLGATRLGVLLHVTLPLSAPGIISGLVLTFVFCFTAYLTPALLGGGFYKMIGNLIYEQAVGRFNYSLAGAAAAITLLVSLAVIFGINAIGQRLFGVGAR